MLEKEKALITIGRLFQRRDTRKESEMAVSVPFEKPFDDYQLELLIGGKLLLVKYFDGENYEKELVKIYLMHFPLTLNLAEVICSVINQHQKLLNGEGIVL